ncbi:hypothetical protein DVB69_05540 [Sporosarcina sp. BI001-red]|nr:hypothetical protein DVB69_05540 [Sporosarcina sp. BI001-red]
MPEGIMCLGMVLDQFRVVVRHWEGIVRQKWMVLHHSGRFLQHLAKFLDKGTQFNTVKGLIGCASLVWGRAISLREGTWCLGSVLDQKCRVVRHWEGIVHQMRMVLHHIGGFLRHLAKFLDKGTQFNNVKG